MAPSIDALMRLRLVEDELAFLDMALNASKSVCIRYGPRFDSDCGENSTNDGDCLPFSNRENLVPRFPVPRFPPPYFSWSPVFHSRVFSVPAGLAPAGILAFFLVASRKFKISLDNNKKFFIDHLMLFSGKLAV